MRSEASPLRDLAVILALSLMVAYEASPDLQSWINYQLLRAGQWFRYGLERARFEWRAARR